MGSSGEPPHFRLEQAHVIRGYTAIVDRGVLGHSVEAFAELAFGARAAVGVIESDRGVRSSDPVALNGRKAIPTSLPAMITVPTLAFTPFVGQPDYAAIAALVW